MDDSSGVAAVAPDHTPLWIPNARNADCPYIAASLRQGRFCVCAPVTFNCGTGRGSDFRRVLQWRLSEEPFQYGGDFRFAFGWIMCDVLFPLEVLLNGCTI